MRKYVDLRANIALGLIFAFLFNMFGPLPVQAQEFYLPVPGQMVALSPTFSPAVLKGIKLDPKNPFRFHFFVDKGDSKLSQDEVKSESAKLIKYFLASLTIPEKDLWVNLSPYEKDRIVPQEFGQTEMGRDLLAEDYFLKQITASLIYPESKLGKEFWQKVYAKAQSQYGTTNIPVNTFNKVWIVPEKAVVYENGGTAFVLENHLKVMLEQDYLSLEKHAGIKSVPAQAKDTNQLGSTIVREIVIPALTKEVNEGKNFAQLRQVFYSLILATWYKNKIKDSILNKVYSNHNKINGVNVSVQDKDKIYQEYLKAFKKGVYNYIKEETDPITNQPVPRKYFSGGVEGSVLPEVEIYYNNPNQVSPAQLAAIDRAQITDVLIDLKFNQAEKIPRSGDVRPRRDRAMLINPELRKEMGDLILDSFKFDTVSPQELEFEEFKRRLSEFDEKNVYVEHGNANFSINPIIRRGLVFGQLSPDQDYTIKLYWENGLGIRVYFISKEHVIRYDVDHFRDVTTGPGKKGCWARFIVRENSLEAARNYPNELIGKIVASSWSIDPWEPDSKQLASYMTLLNYSPADGFEITTTNGVETGVKTATYVITMSRNNNIFFQGLRLKTKYQIKLYWEEGLGLRLYFLSNGEIIRFAIPGKEHQLLTEERVKHFAQVRCRGNDFVKMRYAPDELLDVIFQKSSNINPLTPDEHQLAILHERLIYFNEHPLIIANDDELKRTSVFSYNLLEFHSLRQGESYVVQLFWEKYLGLRIYFVGQKETAVYKLNGNARRGNGKLSARFIKRESELESARRARSELMGELINDSLSLSVDDPDGEALQKLEEKLNYFRENKYTITSSDVSGCLTTELKKGSTIIFHSLQPKSNYLVIPYWEAHLGLVIYFINSQEALAYEIVKNGVRRKPSDANKISTQLSARGTTLEEVQRYERMVGSLAALIEENFSLMNPTLDATRLDKFEQQLELFRLQNYRVESSPGERASWTMPPKRRVAVSFRPLQGNAHYTVIPYWEKDLGLRIYFVSLHDIVVFNVPRNTHEANNKYSIIHTTYISVRTSNLMDARLVTQLIGRGIKLRARPIPAYKLKEPLNTNRISDGTTDDWFIDRIFSNNLRIKLLQHGYTTEEIDDFIILADDVVDGMSLSEAFDNLGVDGDRREWFETQWRDVLPQVLEEYAVDGAMSTQSRSRNSILLGESPVSKQIEGVLMSSGATVEKNPIWQPLSLGKQAATSDFQRAFPNFSDQFAQIERLMQGESLGQVFGPQAVMLPFKNIVFMKMASPGIDVSTGLSITSGSRIQNGNLDVYFSPGNIVGTFCELYEHVILPVEHVPSSQRHLLAMFAETAFYDSYISQRVENQIERLLEGDKNRLDDILEGYYRSGPFLDDLFGDFEDPAEDGFPTIEAARRYYAHEYMYFVNAILIAKKARKDLKTTFHEGRASFLTDDQSKLMAEKVFLSLNNEGRHATDFSAVYRLNYKHQRLETVLIRLGYLFFMDLDCYLGLKEELKKELGGNVILLPELRDTAIGRREGAAHPRRMVEAMIREHVGDYDVWESGAGLAELSLAAYKLGSPMTDAFEIDGGVFKLMKENFALNGLVEGTDVNSHLGDVTDLKFIEPLALKIQRRLKKSGRGLAIITNMGEWPFYSANNLHSINLISYLPSTSLFIAGGITPDQIESVKRDQREIQGHGFTIKENNAELQDALSDIVWVAVRDEAMNTETSKKLWDMADTIVYVHPIQTPKFKGFKELMDHFTHKVLLFSKNFSVPRNVASRKDIRFIRNSEGEYSSQDIYSSVFIGGSLLDCLGKAINFAVHGSFKAGQRTFTAHLISSMVWMRMEAFTEPTTLEDVIRDVEIHTYGRLFLVSKDDYIEKIFGGSNAEDLLGEQFKNNSKVIVRINGEEHTVYDKGNAHQVVIDILRPDDAKLSNPALPAGDGDEAMNAELINLHKIQHELGARISNLIGWMSLLEFNSHSKERIPHDFKNLQRLLEISYSEQQLFGVLIHEMDVDDYGIYFSQMNGHLENFRSALHEFHDEEIEARPEFQTMLKALNDVLDNFLPQVLGSKLDFNKVEKKLVSLNMVIDVATEYMVNKESIHKEYSDSLNEISIDPFKLGEVIINLVRNAQDAIDGSGIKGGQITIKTEREDSPEGPRAKIIVSDNGPGISPDVLPHIFEPFYTTKGNKGTGLGLDICKQIVEAHGGTIGVESQLGHGTTFIVRLPIDRAMNALDGPYVKGKEFLKKLVTKPEGMGWEEYFKETSLSLDDLNGLKIGKTDRLGRIAFSPYTNFPYYWAAFGFSQLGWEGEVIRGEIKGSYFELEIRWSKEGEKTHNKVYQLGHWETIINGQGKRKGGEKAILEIDDRMGMKAILEIIRGEKNFNEVGNLKGLRVGKTNSMGVIMVSPYEGFPYAWYPLEFEDSDWEGEIVRSKVKGSYFEIEIKWSKGKRKFNKIYQIGPWERILKGQGTIKGAEKGVLEISYRLGLRAIAEIVRGEKKFNEVRDLKGLKIGKTNSQGAISFKLYDNFQYSWPALGFSDSGWEGEIVRSGTKGNGKYFEIEVRWNKKGKKGFNKIYQIGPWQRILKGKYSTQNEEKKALEIDERLGLKAIGEIIRDESKFEDIDELNGLRIGKTDSNGTITFSPYEYFPYQWPALGFCSSGWKGEIVSSRFKNGELRFEIQFSKENEDPIFRSFIISHFEKQLKGVGKEKTRVKMIPMIVSMQKLVKLLEPAVNWGNHQEVRWENGERVPIGTDNEKVDYDLILDTIGKTTRLMTAAQREIVGMIVDEYSDGEIITELGVEQGEIDRVKQILQEALRDFAMLESKGDIKPHLDPAMRAVFSIDQVDGKFLENSSIVWQSSSAVRVIGPRGQVFYVKLQRNEGSLLDEYLGYRIARKMGVHVPDFKLLRNHEVEKLPNLLKRLSSYDTTFALVTQPVQKYRPQGGIQYSGLEELVAFAYFMKRRDYYINDYDRNHIHRKNRQYITYDLQSSFGGVSDYEENNVLRWVSQIDKMDIKKLVTLVGEYEKMNLDVSDGIYEESRDIEVREALEQRQKQMRNDLIRGLKTQEYRNNPKIDELITDLENEAMLVPVALQGRLVDQAEGMISRKGGVDFNPAQMSMQVKKDGQDFKFDFNGIEIDAAQVTGAQFTIRTMTPVTDLAGILGLGQGVK